MSAPPATIGMFCPRVEKSAFGLGARIVDNALYAFSPRICSSGAKVESARVRCLGFADELVWGEASEAFEASGEIVGVDEVAQVRSELAVGFQEVTFDGRITDGAVHSFDLPIVPWTLGLCQPMIDVVLGASVLEGVRSNELSSRLGGLDARRKAARTRERLRWPPEAEALASLLRGKHNRQSPCWRASRAAFVL
jgi:hypothetical protein